MFRWISGMTIAVFLISSISAVKETSAEELELLDETDIDWDTFSDRLQDQEETDVDLGEQIRQQGAQTVCKNKLGNARCKNQWKKGKCKKSRWVQKVCKATCGSCCGNKWEDSGRVKIGGCHKIRNFCGRSFKIRRGCKKACGKC